MKKNDKAKSEKNFSLFTFRFSLFTHCCLFLCLILFSSACLNSGNSNSSAGGGGLDVFGLTDQTAEADRLVAEANDELRKIRAMYKQNQDKVGQLKTAMEEKRVEDVKAIANELVYLINEGSLLGESAIAKIEQARAMNINETFKEYLRLKEESLRAQRDAFEYRHRFARLLRDEFGTKDKFEVDKVTTAFQDMEENFQKKWEEARQLSGQANQLADDSLRNKAG
jgi:hypothetical protein